MAPFFLVLHGHFGKRVRNGCPNVICVVGLLKKSWACLFDSTSGRAQKFIEGGSENGVLQILRDGGGEDLLLKINILSA